MLWHSQQSKSRCFPGTLLPFQRSNGCWQFDLTAQGILQIQGWGKPTRNYIHGGHTEKGHSQKPPCPLLQCLACAAGPRPTWAHQMSFHVEPLCGQHLLSRHSGRTPPTALFSGRMCLSGISFCLCQFSLFWPKGWRKSITPLWGLEWPPGEPGSKMSKGLRLKASGRPCLSA